MHRPRYDDWSLPKGKLEPGETAAGSRPCARCARRSAPRSRSSRRVGTVRYTVGDTPKRVTYWAMQYRNGEFLPNLEVSDVQWLPLGQAVQRLTYDVDRAVLTDFASMPEPDAVIVLVRHAKAGKRSQVARAGR